MGSLVAGIRDAACMLLVEDDAPLGAVPGGATRVGVRDGRRGLRRRRRWCDSLLLHGLDADVGA